MVEPIVSRDEIRRRAQAAVHAGLALDGSNPYPAGSQAAVHFDLDFRAHERELDELEA